MIDIVAHSCIYIDTHWVVNNHHVCCIKVENLIPLLGKNHVKIAVCGWHGDTAKFNVIPRVSSNKNDLTICVDMIDNA